MGLDKIVTMRAQLSHCVLVSIPLGVSVVLCCSADTEEVG